MPSSSKMAILGFVYFFVFVANAACLVDGFSPMIVTTRTYLNESPEDVQAFLASPGNWPKIVSTSMGVKSDQDVSKPLKVGKTVDELFGLPPIIPLKVQWTCTQDNRPAFNKQSKASIYSKRKPEQSSGGRLEFFSPKGLEGVAKNCEMGFDVLSKRIKARDGTEVILNMKYQPESPLAVLALPILNVDNYVALNFLLPAAMKEQPELDKFRTLMGSLYGGAGLAHLTDCVFGSSQLLTMSGAPTFQAMPVLGQIYTLFWGLAGPVSFGLSRAGAGYADMGLLLYGFIEVGGAALVAANYGNADVANPVLGALFVQGIVGLAWFYSANKSCSIEG